MNTPLPHIVIIAGACLSYLVANSVWANDPQPIYYQDCAYMEFDEVDSHELTRNEEISLMDENFFAALDRSAECMDTAATSGAKRIGDAAGSAEAAATVAGGSDGTATASAEASQTTQQQTQPRQTGDTTGADTQRGDVGKGSSAVCDAVKQGLSTATTEAEKAHWQGLSKEYGCQ